jgi:hypothetical protein
MPPDAKIAARAEEALCYEINIYWEIAEFSAAAF